MNATPERPPEDDGTEDVSTPPRVGGADEIPTELVPIEDVDTRPRVGEPDTIKKRRFVSGDDGTP